MVLAVCSRQACLEVKRAWEGRLLPGWVSRGVTPLIPEKSVEQSGIDTHLYSEVSRKKRGNWAFIGLLTSWVMRLTVTNSGWKLCPGAGLTPRCEDEEPWVWKLSFVFRSKATCGCRLWLHMGAHYSSLPALYEVVAAEIHSLIGAEATYVLPGTYGPQTLVHCVWFIWRLSGWMMISIWSRHCCLHSHTASCHFYKKQHLLMKYYYILNIIVFNNWHFCSEILWVHFTYLEFLHKTFDTIYVTWRPKYGETFLTLMPL